MAAEERRCFRSRDTFRAIVDISAFRAEQISLSNRVEDRIGARALL